MLRGFVFAHHVETLERALPRDSDIEIDHPYKAPTIKQTSYLLAIQLVIDRFLIDRKWEGSLRRRIIKDSPEIVDWSRYSKPIKTIASVLSDCYEAIQIMPAIVPLENLEKMNLRLVRSTSRIWDSSMHNATLPAVQAFTIAQVSYDSERVKRLLHEPLLPALESTLNAVAKSNGYPGGAEVTLGWASQSANLEYAWWTVIALQPYMMRRPSGNAVHQWISDVCSNRRLIENALKP